MGRMYVTRKNQCKKGRLLKQRRAPIEIDRVVQIQ